MLKKNIKFNKTRWNQKWKIPQTILERWNMWFSSYMYHEFKVKMWWVGAPERKKSRLFVTFILSEEILLTFVIFSLYTMHWMNFQNIHNFTYQKTLFHTLLLLVFKFLESLYCIFNNINQWCLKWQKHYLKEPAFWQVDGHDRRNRINPFSYTALSQNNYMLTTYFYTF